MHKLKRNNKRAIQHFQIPPQLKNDTRRKKTNVGRYQREKKCTKLNEIIIKHSTFPNSTTAQNDTKPTKSIREKKKNEIETREVQCDLGEFLHPPQRPVRRGERRYRHNSWRPEWGYCYSQPLLLCSLPILATTFRIPSLSVTRFWVVINNWMMRNEKIGYGGRWLSGMEDSFWGFMCSAENGAKCSSAMEKHQSQLGRVSDTEESKRCRLEISMGGSNPGPYGTRAAQSHIVLPRAGPIITATSHLF